jgi:glycosyltransferase involved in cell wall biosynthesis
LSNEPLSEMHYEEMVRGADVGIALYDGRVSENMYYAGYSSGKIAQYLKCGIPIIVNNIPLMQELINQYKCGFCINDLKEIAPALKEIAFRYDYYAKGALEAFATVFAPENNIGAILDRLKMESIL